MLRRCPHPHCRKMGRGSLRYSHHTKKRDGFYHPACWLEAKCQEVSIEANWCLIHDVLWIGDAYIELAGLTRSFCEYFEEHFVTPERRLTEELRGPARRVDRVRKLECRCKDVLRYGWFRQPRVEERRKS